MGSSTSTTGRLRDRIGVSDPHGVADVLATGGEQLDDLRVEIHERVDGMDGTYDFDATARYRWAGLDFLVVVGAKRHTNPIKRELVQILHSKVQSVGAHKGVMVSAAPFQSGAVEFAQRHGIALVSLAEARFTFETRSLSPRPPLSGTSQSIGHRFRSASCAPRDPEQDYSIW